MIEAKETVVGSLGSKGTLKGSTNTSSTYTSEYILPIASETVLGGVKVGENLSITEDGTLNAESGGVTSYNDLTDKPTIPDKLSQLENDKKFVSETYVNDAIEEAKLSGGNVDLTDYAKKSDLTNLATKNELHNHSNKSVLDSITQDNIDSWNSGTGGGNVDLSDYALKTDIPKKVSQLTNDKNYINQIKTINGQTLIGEGNINIAGGSGGSSNFVVSPTQPTAGEEVWFQKSVNLYNQESDTKKIYIDEDGAEKEDITCNVTDYIRVEPNESYTYQGLTYTPETTKFYDAYYDINKNLVSTFRLTEETGTITIPDNIYYVRLSVNNSDYRFFQFEKGTIAGTYQQYVDDEIYTKVSDGSYDRFGTKHSEVTETNYELLEYKPQINGVELKGNISTSQLGFPQYTAGTGISLVNNVITATGEATVVTEDTGWLSAELTSSFRDYYDSGDYHPQYRKRDKTVSIRGIVKPKSTISSGGSATIFTLPEGFRPSYEVSKVCAGSSKNTWLMYIARSGNVSFNRYGTTANASCGTSAYLPFECTFMID